MYYAHAVVYARHNEDIESLLRRFKLEVGRCGILSEIKKREYYIKPSLRNHQREVNMRYNRKLVNTGKIKPKRG